jgi:ATPase family associated with various cellular activities (AAA)
MQEGLFGRVLEYPDPEAQRRLEGLVGIDANKEALIREARILLDPSALERWSNQHYGGILPVVAEVANRTPLVVLAGDVGVGKTELAESFPDAVAREMKVPIVLYPLSLSARGRGAVGEMTTLLTTAFEAVTEAARGARDSKGNIRSGVILLVDEADALAQSRELAQMHHEDRAGVNALIRGVDGLRRQGAPVLTVMCTNRESALDPAVLRRAAAILPFSRPNDAQRGELFGAALAGAGLGAASLDELVRLTGPRDGRSYGCTFSDLRQRFLVEVVLDSLDRGPLNGERMVALAAEFVPTPPFGGANG